MKGIVAKDRKHMIAFETFRECPSVEETKVNTVESPENKMLETLKLFCLEQNFVLKGLKLQRNVKADIQSHIVQTTTSS